MTILGILAVLLAFAGAVVFAVIVRVFSEDAKTYIPRLARRMLRQAASRIGKEHEDSFFEEWCAHLDDTPELSGKLWHATAVYFWGASRVKKLVCHSSKASSLRDTIIRSLEIFLIIASIPFLIPFLFLVAIAVKQDGLPALYSFKSVGRNGNVVILYRFRTSVPNPDKVLKMYLAQHPDALRRNSLTANTD